MSVSGRIYNRLFSSTPQTMEAIYTKTRVKLHNTEPTILHRNIQTTGLSNQDALPSPDRIAFSHQKHKNLQLRQLQQEYNTSVGQLQTITSEIARLAKQKNHATNLFQKNPHRHATQKSTISMLEGGLLQKNQQRQNISTQLLGVRESYYNGLNPHSSSYLRGSSRSRGSIAGSTKSGDDGESDGASAGSRSSAVQSESGKPRFKNEHHTIVTSYEPIGDTADLAGMGDASISAGVYLPTDTMHVAANVTTDYLSAAVTLSSLDSLVSFHKEVQHLSHAIEQVAKLKETFGNTEQLTALDRFLREERKTAKFCKYIPGLSSGASGALSVGGQFVGALSPIGLFASAANSVAHVVDTTRLLRQNTKAQLGIKAEFEADPRQSAQIEMRHLQQERRLLHLTRVGWGGIAAGAATLGVASTAALGVGISHAAPILVPLGLAVATPSIIGATIWNNAIYGKRFTPGLSAQLGAQIEALSDAVEQNDLAQAQRLLHSLPNKRSLENDLLQSERKRLVAKEFRAQMLPTLGSTAHAAKNARSVALCIVGTVTLGLMHRPMKRLKRSCQESVVQSLAVDEEYRLAMLQKLNVQGPEHSTSVTPPSHATHDAHQGQDAPATQIRAFLGLIDSIERNRSTRVAIARLVTAKVLRTKRSLIGNSVAGTVTFAKKFEWLPEVDRLLTLGDGHGKSSLAEVFQAFSNCAIPSQTEKKTHAVFERLRMLANAPDSALTPERRGQLIQLTQQSCDEYLMFHARDEAKIQRGAATRMLSAWRGRP